MRLSRKVLFVSLAGAGVLVWSFFALDRWSQSVIVSSYVEHREPSAKVVASGQCVVPTCTDVDLGDLYLRYYADGVAKMNTTYIPKGACSCTKIQETKPGLTKMFYMKTAGNSYVGYQNIGVIPRCESRQADKMFMRETTYEMFTRLKGEYQEVPDFDFEGGKFLQYKTYKNTAPNRGKGQYIFVPRKDEFELAGHTQKIAIKTGFGLPEAEFGSPKESSHHKMGRELFSTVRVSECVYLWGLFRISDSGFDQTQSSFARAAASVLENRLFPKNDVRKVTRP